MALLDLWNTTPDQLSDKQVHQLIAFAGAGRLLDDSSCSIEFRTFLASVPAKHLQTYSDQCLTETFDGSGFALQDIVNEVGARLGASVKPGRYRGTQKHTGQDGLWHFPNGRSILIEVKTTDAYSINLNTIAGYRKALISDGKIVEDTSSILLIVGRQETDNLEAQIRGSKFAWNVRVISVDALLRLMFTKEEVEDPTLLQRIHAILVPYEFTRLDGIADLLFSAAKEIKQEDSDVRVVTDNSSEKSDTPKFTPVAFHDDCIKRVQKMLGVSLVKRTRSGYSTPDNATAVVCSVSKEHNPGKNPNYWFAFHPHQQAFLAQYPTTFVAFGCGSGKQVLLVPYKTFEPWLEGSWTTTNDDRTYWHVVIYRKMHKFELRLRKGKKAIDVTHYLITSEAQPSAQAEIQRQDA
jgi:hypothetical protein